jgi:hypothetical protein
MYMAITRKVFQVIFSLLVASGLEAASCTCCEICHTCKIHPTLEIKSGYFFFTSSKMNRVYNQGGIDLQLSDACPVNSWLRIYGSVEYFKKWGRSTGLLEKTSLWAVPVSLGLQPIFKINCDPDIQYYFTIGPRYNCSVKVHNRSSHVPHHMDSHRLAGFINTGFIFAIYRHVMFDAFGEYSYSRLRFHPARTGTSTPKVQLSGLVFGVSFGYVF